MSKQKHTAQKNKRRIPSPLVIIGGTILVLAAGFYLISGYVIDNRDPEAVRTLAEQAGEQTAPKSLFRDDAALTFRDENGSDLVSVNVEIAETEEARTQGLMGRDRMAEEEGMLFIFPDQQFRSFWMANTPLPLDILFVNEAGTIVTIQRNTVPYSEESIPSTAPARYVIEVNAGFCDRHGIREGLNVHWVRM